jgi:hypothetical protein
VRRLRTAAWGAYYRLMVRADPGADDDLLGNAKRIIELSRRITAYTKTETEMEQRSSAVNEELDRFAKAAAHRRVSKGYPS